MAYLPGIGVLLFTLSDIRRGEANLLDSFLGADLSIERSGSGILFWGVMVVQLLIVAALLLVGRLIEVAMS
ncbi:hypothetical protein OJ996_17280 [Luteolibacter sp. GHJ8]|uniref:Uncharacterized protein n=1 Tax=Luteolibacter rhizosphaerae TaxID=2989719 RepID=A0ABT3G671_9BACT|nr:hypothetical protein [Luteolibacter rhizosphaerae]MCW1915341.1 hypothetical protein [Luteolibacter rhizosphaerae]